MPPEVVISVKLPFPEESPLLAIQILFELSTAIPKGKNGETKEE